MGSKSFKFCHSRSRNSYSEVRDEADERPRSGASAVPVEEPFQGVGRPARVGHRGPEHRLRLQDLQALDEKAKPIPRAHNVRLLAAIRIKFLHLLAHDLILASYSWYTMSRNGTCVTADR